MNGGSTATATLIEFGAKYNPAILENNEWWRIISATFLHIGFLHLIMNMLAVYYLGTVVERIYGRFRFLFIYFLAGIGGGLASLSFTVNISAGASGAIFGLFGALLFFGLIYKQIFLQTMGYNILFILGINLIFGLFIQQIDMAAHLGGLATGFIASAIVYLPRKRNLIKQSLAVGIYLIVFVGLVILGYENNEKNQAYHLMAAESSVQEENYQEVVESTTRGLELPGDVHGILLFHRSYAYIELNEINLAIDDLEKSLTYEKLPESYYNLAILYYNTGELKKAEENIAQAYKMDPEIEGIAELYETIIGESVKK
ncbi:rhomboid family intramembrane serine protease [Oceanobacillus sp. 143]|nr:rhomboid family intramembrane serine protease [Oceanobacillus sp. 143]